MMSMEKLVIEVRINEGTSKGENPHVPYSPEEIADQARDCCSTSWTPAFPPEANWPWIVNAVGANAFPVIAGAIERGGHVAVGIPDCSYAELGPPTNAELVRHVIDMAHTMGPEVATAAEAREILGFA
jgi:uncharacterized protein (DUF849 family)